MAGLQLRQTVYGLDELLQRLDKAVSVEVRAKAMEALKERLLKRLTTYPPERPGQSYERTTNLGRNWRASVNAQGSNQYASQVSATISNSTSYAPWVQGFDRQAWMHKDRWVTDQAVLDEEEPRFLNDLERGIQDALNGN